MSANLSQPQSPIMAATDSVLNRPDLCWLEKVAWIAYQMKMLDEGIEAPVKHIFEPGMYIREMTIPAGVVVVGRPHILGHRTQLVSGRVLLVTDEERQTISAPYEIQTVPNFQIVVYTLEPSVARTYHPNPEEDRDVERITNKWFLPPEPILQLGSMVHARLIQE